MGLYADYSKLERKKAEMEADLNQVKTELSAMEKQVLERMAEDELQRVTVKSTGRTLYINETLTAKLDPAGLEELSKSDADREKAIRKAKLAKALKGIRGPDGTFSDLVTEGFNWNSLSSRFRELCEECGEDEMGNPLYELPETLEGLVCLDRIFRVKSVAA